MPQSDIEGAVQLGEDLRAQVADCFLADPDLAGASISLGVSMFGHEADGGTEAVLVAADEAMYRSKQDGRNRITLFEGPDAARSARGQTTSAKIRDALTQNRLSLAMQPIHSLSDGAVERHELLLRMTGAGGELLPAAAFIEVAERSGMVQELDRWVIGRALDLLESQQREGEPFKLHVNLSGVSLSDVSVLEFIERRLDEGDADPGRCTFEITQTARVEDIETAAGFADRLTEFGCEVAIDDYGAGFGPFEYLKRFPFDVIKIDGTFVRDLPHNDADQLTVKAIVGIARGLGKATIAEFVEDEATARLLREYGVDMAQGFHLGRPVGVVEGTGDRKLATRPPAQLGALDLAARRLRQLGGEVDDAGGLVRRGLGFAPVLELVGELLAGLAVAGDDDRADDAAALGVGGRDCRRLGDRRVGQKRRLDLGRADPVAGAEDDVVVAALEEEEAVVVGGDEVTGRPPLALEALAVEVAREEGRGGGGAELHLAPRRSAPPSPAAAPPSTPGGPAGRRGWR